MKRISYLLSIGLLLLAVATFTSCGRDNANRVAPPHTAHYLADSTRLFDRANAYFERHQYPEAVPLLDSVFYLPLSTAATPDGLSAPEATLLCRRALRELMENYNITRRADEGYQHFDSIEQLRHPIVDRHCRMALWTAKAQMLLHLEREEEAIDYLDRAEAIIDEADSPDYEIYWTAVIGVSYMGIDAIDTRAQDALLRSIEIAQRTEVTNSMYPEALARLADILLQQERYEESISLCRYNLNMGNPEQNYYARLVAAEKLTKAYTLLALWDEALRYCAIGTNYASHPKVNHRLKGRFYLAKATIHAERQEQDSMLEALQHADSCFRHTGDAHLNALMETERARFLNYVPGANRASQLATANSRFAIREKEIKNRLLAAEVKLKKNYMVASVSTALLLILIVSILLVMYNARRRAWRLQQFFMEQERKVAEAHLAVKESELRQLITTRQELNNRHHQLLAELTAIQANNKDSRHLDKVIKSIQSALVTSKEEEKFRSAFLALYPMAINRLRTVCPTITHGEELFAMLTALKLNSEEIAHTLGIARKSVTKIRYRLRNKLGLDGEVDVDEYLRMLQFSTI